MNKFQRQGIVAQSFTHASISTAAVNDLVQISGDLTVTTATTGRAIGRVITIDKYKGTVVVELFAAQIFEVTVGATAVVAGNNVKMSAANTVIPAAPATVATDIPLAFGIALNGGATGATISVVPRG